MIEERMGIIPGYVLVGSTPSPVLAAQGHAARREVPVREISTATVLDAGAIGGL